MKRRIKDLPKRQLYSIHKLGTRFGIHILPVHYYSSIPDIFELEKTKNIWTRKSELPGLRIDLEEQVDNLKHICMPYQSEYQGNKAYRHAVANAFGPGYGYIEARALHALVRHFKPKRVVEVGSGVSTWCMLNVEHNFLIRETIRPTIKLLIPLLLAIYFQKNKKLWLSFAS